MRSVPVVKGKGASRVVFVAPCVIVGMWRCWLCCRGDVCAAVVAAEEAVPCRTSIAVEGKSGEKRIEGGGWWGGFERRESLMIAEIYACCGRRALS